MLQDIIGTVIRSVIAYFILLLITRLLGRKAISQMSIFDFVIVITLGTLTADASVDAETNTVKAVTAMVTLAVLGVLTDFAHIRSRTLRKLVTGKPVVLIQDGEIIKKNMRKSRLTLNDLTSMLRQKNAFNIGDVAFAVFENYGELSVLFKSDKQPPKASDMNIRPPYASLFTDLIIDGNILYKNLHQINLNEQWLTAQLNKRGIDDAGEVFYAAYDPGGGLLYLASGTANKGNYAIE